MDEGTEEEGEDEDGYHGVVAPVAEVEGLAPEGAGEGLAELQRGLAAEEEGVEASKVVVEVGEAAVELVGVGVPEDEPGKLSNGAEEGGEGGDER